MKYIVPLFMLLLTLAGCKLLINPASDVPAAPDYSNDSSWAAKPEKINKTVDVFYVYPTIYTGKEPSNMDIASPDMRETAKGLTIAQAGVYSPYANLFAPFYRQQSAAGQSMEAANGGKDAFADPAFLVGAKDIEKAFDFYINRLNPDRPFIIAGHSQGTMALIHLMRKKFNDPRLQKRLIAAYLIGYSVTKTDLKQYPWMKLAQGEKDTGVIITYNTEGPDAGPSPVLLKEAGVINPLNWKTDQTPATRDQNMGAKFFHDSTGRLIEQIPNFAGASIDLQKGVLVVTDMQTPSSEEIDLKHLGRWSKGVYHKFDYAFWFNNLKANVKTRIAAYLKEKP